MIGGVYEEMAPPRRLHGVARCVWRSASEGPKRIVPDGCVDLVTGDGEVFVAGPDTTAWSSLSRPGAVLEGIRFTPGRAAAVLGVAADELRDRRVPLGELWGRAGEAVAERLLSGEWSLAEAVGSRVSEVAPPDLAVAELIARLDAGVGRVGEAVAGLVRGGPGAAQVAALLAKTAPEGARIAEAARLLARAGSEGARIAQAAVGQGKPEAAHIAQAAALLAQGKPEAARNPETIAAPSHPGAGPAELAARRVEDPAASVAVSERRLRRRFVQAVGYGPATYLRVSRFQRAVALAPHIPALAALAAAAGYADQAHLSRDCRALTGLTPRAYFRRPSTVDVAERDRLRSA